MHFEYLKVSWMEISLTIGRRVEVNGVGANTDFKECLAFFTSQ